MNRACLRLDAIRVATEMIPERIRERVHCDYLIGCDPGFVDLHAYTKATYGRAYKDTAHVTYRHNQHAPSRADRVTTIVLPDTTTPTVIVHELGHVLHESIGFDHQQMTPTTWYAKTNPYEAFAEAFTAWVGAPGYEHVRPTSQDAAIFRSLA